jgi:hypothetical protein
MQQQILEGVVVVVVLAVVEQVVMVLQVGPV